jgi:FkbM family methyltransferase
MACRRRITHKLIAALALVVTAQLSAGCTRLFQKQRCVFIDGGAHFGESYTDFRKTNLYSQYSWEIFAIEANPNLIARLPHAPRLTVINKAIWVNDGTLTFHMQSDTSGSNSLLKKFEGADAKDITVQCFDFNEWVKRSFSPDDYVILTLDIEGAEFEVLDKMSKDGTFKYLDRLYVSWHPGLLEGKSMKEGEAWAFQLMQRARRKVLIIGDDSADKMMRRGDWVDFLL